MTLCVDTGVLTGIPEAIVMSVLIIVLGLIALALISQRRPRP